MQRLTDVYSWNAVWRRRWHESNHCHHADGASENTTAGCWPNRCVVLGTKFCIWHDRVLSVFICLLAKFLWLLQSRWRHSVLYLAIRLPVILYVTRFVNMIFFKVKNWFCCKLAQAVFRARRWNDRLCGSVGQRSRLREADIGQNYDHNIS